MYKGAENMTQNDNSALQRFNKIWDRVNAAYHKASGRMGLADSELTILYMLFDYQRPFSQSEIIQLTGLSKQTVNSSVRRMEEAGWLVLGERSNRHRQMTLTERGMDVVHEKIVPFVEREAAIFDQWTEEERETFLGLMERYETALNEIAEQIENTRR